MLNLAFVITNYNNSILSLKAAESIDLNKGNNSCRLIIVDNASDQSERAILSEPGSLPINCSVIWNSSNQGYFKGLNIGISAVLEGGSSYDAIVVGNNDLLFKREFFDGLNSRKDILDKVSVISPDIITLDGDHQNPHVLVGVSRFREIVWDLYFLSFTLSKIIGWTARKGGSILRRKDHLWHRKEGCIDQGYGACYILTKNYIGNYKRLWSPGFLMGEEFYLTRQLKSRGEKIYYIPDVIVIHHDHATVSKIPSRQLWRSARQAHKVYRYFISPYRFVMDNNKTPIDYDATNLK